MSLSNRMDKWDLRFMKLAVEVRSWSKDPSRKVGCVLVATSKRQFSLGYNGLPQGYNDGVEAMDDHTWRLANTRHAEQNAVDQAPFDLFGATAYVTRFPCLDCAERLLNAGITKIWSPVYAPAHPRWGDSWTQAYGKLVQAGVEVNFYNEMLTEKDGML